MLPRMGVSTVESAVSRDFHSSLLPHHPRNLQTEGKVCPLDKVGEFLAKCRRDVYVEGQPAQRAEMEREDSIALILAGAETLPKANHSGLSCQKHWRRCASLS